MSMHRQLGKAYAILKCPNLALIVELVIQRPLDVGIHISKYLMLGSVGEDEQ